MNQTSALLVFKYKMVSYSLNIQAAARFQNALQATILSALIGIYLLKYSA